MKETVYETFSAAETHALGKKIGEHLILFEDSMSAERALYDSGFVTGSFGSSYTDRKKDNIYGSSETRHSL